VTAPSVDLFLDTDTAPFDLADAVYVARGVHRRADGAVILADACGSGFDLVVLPEGDRLSVTARYRPAPKTALANAVLRSRFRLLARATLTQYPALWWAGRSGRAPVHISAVTTGGPAIGLIGPSGVGKSTLVRHALAAGGRATSDNLAVTDGRQLFGVAEPVKSDGASGRRTSHGRREEPLRDCAPVLMPGLLAVVSLHDGPIAVERLDPATAARSIVTSTYMAGELARYWAFAAALSSATGVGQPHSPVADVAAALVANADAIYGVTLSRQAPVHFEDLLAQLSAAPRQRV
jgi:hypothetical protein